MHEGAVHGSLLVSGAFLEVKGSLSGSCTNPQALKQTKLPNKTKYVIAFFIPYIYRN